MIFDLINKIKNPSKYIVDIGSSYGAECDPLYQFITGKDYNGLCIEGNKAKVSQLKLKTSLDIYGDYINPENILDVFNKFNVPISPDIIKIDIDGYDLEVIRKILTVYKPKIIIAEINEKIPPPILFEVKYKSNYNWDESHFFGFSISSGERVMKQNNYKILSIYDVNNIICVDDELSTTLNSNDDIINIYKTGYIDNIKRNEFYWNNNVNYWLNISDKETLKNEITNYFVNINDRSTSIIKTKIKDVDFVIE
jgi:hypothetical protein